MGKFHKSVYHLHGTCSLFLFDEKAKMYKWSRKRSFESVGHLSSLLFRPISPSSYLLAWKTRERSDGRDFVVKLIQVEKDTGFNIHWKLKPNELIIIITSDSVIVSSSLLLRSSSSSLGWKNYRKGICNLQGKQCEVNNFYVTWFHK